MLGLCACVSQESPHDRARLPLQPGASIQELMQTEIDPSADGVWNAVQTVATRAGNERRQPRTSREWATAHDAAVKLIAASNLLLIEGRHVGAREFPAESDGALDSAHIQALIDSNRLAFDGYAVGLRTAVQRALAAIDAKDPDALVNAGGDIDAICEACHLSFWYPNQVIPPFPADDDPNHPILREGSLER